MIKFVHKSWFAAFATLLMAIPSFAQVTTASNSEELVAILKQNKDVGKIILTNSVYSIEGLDVKAGGTIQPAFGVYPVIIGKNVYVSKAGSLTDDSGYWKKKLNKFERGDYYLLDENFQPVLVSGVETGVRNIESFERDIKKLSDKDRKIGVPIKDEYAYLRNKDKSFFRNCTMKLSCWFVCMEVADLYSDEKYVYGIVDSDYNYTKLGKHGYMYTYATLFNYPVKDGMAYIDGQNYIHVPNKYKGVYVCISKNILNLQGGRTLTFNGIRFKASDVPVKMGNNSNNKSFYSCSFENCGTGIEFKNYVDNAEGNVTIQECTFRHLYSNYAIYILPVDNITVKGNEFSHTGILNKGGSVISVNGKNFKVEGNKIQDFSYNGISCGLDEKYNYKTLTGEIRDNIVDNTARLGDASTQLYDGGAIYVYSHISSLIIEGNVVRGFGFTNGLRFGLYLDGGAYNVISKNNLVYNMHPGQQAVHARYVLTSDKRHSSNVFENNIIVGDCHFGGNSNEDAMPTIVRNNYISGKTTFANEKVEFKSNKEVSSKVSGETVYIDRRSKLKKKAYSKNIRAILNTSKKL